MSEGKRQARKRRAELVGGREPFWFSLGDMLMQTVRTSGRNTILLAHRLLQLVRDVIGGGLRQRMEQAGNETRLVKHDLRPNALTVRTRYVPSKDCVLYLLHNSLPYATGGYAIRTHGLLKALVADGWQMHGVTRPGFPFDAAPQRGLNVPQVTPYDAISAVDVLDDVHYSRLLARELNYRTLPTDTYLRRYLEMLLPLSEKYRPALIHGASFFTNGIVAASAARLLGIPSVYEVRGLWEITRISREPGWEKQGGYRLQASAETDACRQATAVITITTALKNLLLDRGIPENKIQVVPNGVDTRRFVPIARDSELESQLGYAGKKVIGYAGAFADYEGLEYLLEAASLLRNKGREDFRVLLVGDGAKYEELQLLCDTLYLRDVVTITGRVPHSEIMRYYSLIDAVALPRKGLPVCEMVSPLKPFEAMSMGKTVVASDVAALAEIVDDGNTGLLHRKDDAEDLARKLETLLDYPELSQRLGEAARKWVVANRDWRILSKIVGDLYRELLGRKVA